jgi:aspartate/methionine/tyrosine aminotransferase
MPIGSSGIGPTPATSPVRATRADGVDRWATALVERTGVLLLPSTVFKSELMQTPTDRFRIGYGRTHLEEGLAVLEADLER